MIKTVLPNQAVRAAYLTLLLVASACTSSAEKHAEHATSPLLGAWTRDGDVPKPQADRPEFTKLTFKPDGAVVAAYVAAGGALAGVLKPAPKMRQETDTYNVVDAKTVRITEGSAARDYTYDVHDGKLYLTGPNGGSAAVFSHSADS